MDRNFDIQERAAELVHADVKRRGLLRFGRLLGAMTGASALTVLGGTKTNAAPGDKNPPNTYIPVTEKGSASGVATLDVDARILPAQLPDLSAVIEAEISASSAMAEKLDKSEAAAAYAPQATAMRTSDLFLSIGKYGDPGPDNTAIIAQAMADAGTAVATAGVRGHDGTFGPACRAVYFPSGVWTSAASVVVPRGVSVVFANGAVLKAAASIDGPLLDTDSLAWEGQSITGGTLDCNLLAQVGLRVRVGRYSTIRDIHIEDPTRHGVVLGDVVLSPSSFEMYLHKVTVRRRAGQPLVAGSQAYNITNKCCDSVFDSCVGISFETGFSNSGGDNRFLNCHVWGFNGAFPLYAFDDVSGSFAHYSQCVADSPATAGFRLRVGFASISQSSVFLASSQTDNTVVGVKLDAGASNLVASNNRFQGANNSVRLLAAYQGADNGWIATSTITGQITAFTNTPWPARNTFAPYSTAGIMAEKTIYIPGTVTATDLPAAVFWSVPVQVDSVVIRANAGSGTQFQIWQGGTQLTPTFNVGDLATLNRPYGSDVPVTLAAYAGLYIKVVTGGNGANLTAVFKARQTG